MKSVKLRRNTGSYRHIFKPGTTYYYDINES